MKHMMIVLGLCAAVGVCAPTVDAANDTDAATRPSVAQAENETDGQAEQPSAEASAQAEPASGDAREALPSPALSGRRSPREATRPIDWEAVQAFAMKHSPRRWSAFDTGQGAGRSLHARAFVAESFQKLMDLKDKDAELYGYRVKELEQEDRIYGICADARAGAIPADEAKTQLHDAVNELMGARLQERQTRVERAATALDQAKNKLARDQSLREKQVDRQVRAIVENGFLPVPPRHKRPHATTMPRQP